MIWWQPAPQKRYQSKIHRPIYIVMCVSWLNENIYKVVNIKGRDCHASSTQILCVAETRSEYPQKSIP